MRLMISSEYKNENPFSYRINTQSFNYFIIKKSNNNVQF